MQIAVLSVLLLNTPAVIVHVQDAGGTAMRGVLVEAFTDSEPSEQIPDYKIDDSDYSNENGDVDIGPIPGNCRKIFLRAMRSDGRKVKRTIPVDKIQDPIIISFD